MSTVRTINDGTELVAIDSLESHPDNPRHGDVERIAESIRENGFYGTLIVQRSTRRILAGNHRWLGAKEAGLAEVPVTWVDVTDDQARKILLVDNKASDDASYDSLALAELLQKIEEEDGTLTGTGFSDDDLAALLADVDPPMRDQIVGLPESVVATHLVFDEEGQQDAWYLFVKWLKAKYPDAETLGERLTTYIREEVGL